MGGVQITNARHAAEVGPPDRSRLRFAFPEGGDFLEIGGVHAAGRDVVSDNSGDDGGEGALKDGDEIAFGWEAVARGPDHEAHDGGAHGAGVERELETERVGPEFFFYAVAVRR